VRIPALIVLAALAAGAAGCGGDSKPSLNLTPLTAEQKRQYMEEERKVFEEEGGKPRPKVKR
jgi:hypothetical protein